jgi:hypothetical protein
MQSYYEVKVLTGRCGVKNGQPGRIMVIKKAARFERPFYTLPYLQFAQVHAEPQLQLTQVQFGLLHFTSFTV